MIARYARGFAAVALAVGVIAAPAGAQSRVEKIQLQHIDARIVAALLGAPVLPNEVDVAMGRLPYGGYPAPGGFNGYGNPLGGARYSPGYGPTAYPQMQWFNRASPQPLASPSPGLVSPATNSYLYRR